MYFEGDNQREDIEKSKCKSSLCSFQHLSKQIPFKYSGFGTHFSQLTHQKSCPKFICNNNFQLPQPDLYFLPFPLTFFLHQLDCPINHRSRDAELPREWTFLQTSSTTYTLSRPSTTRFGVQIHGQCGWFPGKWR